MSLKDDSPRNDGGFPSNMRSWAQFTKNILLENVLHVQNWIQVKQLHPHEEAVNDHFH